MSNELTFNSTTDMIVNRDVMASMQMLAEYMASGKVTTPAHLRGNIGDCMAIILQAAQWKMNPFAVAQKTHEIKGRLGYEAQLVNAVITSMAPTIDRLHYEWFGDWSRIIGKFRINTGDKGEYRVPDWKLKDEEGLGVRVWATMRGEDSPRVLDLLLAQARTRNSTLWADDPKQQLAYLATKRWSALYCPDVILGVYTPEEIESFDSVGERDVTPQKESDLDSIMSKVSSSNDANDFKELDISNYIEKFNKCQSLDELAVIIQDVAAIGSQLTDSQKVVLNEQQKAAKARIKSIQETASNDGFDFD